MFEKRELDAATGGYANKIGEGGFGTVYKGILRGTPVAVKVLTEVVKIYDYYIIPLHYSLYRGGIRWSTK